MGEVTRQTLARYAFFEQARQTSNHPEDALLPLILPSLAGRGHTVFSAQELAEALEPLLGKGLVLSLAESLVDPLVRHGYLHREASLEGGAIYTYTARVNELPVAESISRAETELSEILSAFDLYLEASRTIAPLQFTPERVRELFVDWATTVESQEVLDVGTLAQSEFSGNIRRADAVPENLRLLFSAFVSWLARERPTLFDKVLTFAELGLVIDLVSEIRLPTKKVRQVNLTVILDSRILLELLGLYGPSSQATAQRLVALCRKHGIAVATLVHLVDEVREICFNVLNSPTEYFPGSVNEAIRLHPEILEILRRVFQNPDVHLKREGVQIYPYTQTPNINAERFFTDQDIRRFADNLPYDRSKANMAKRDAWSLAHAVRRQNGVHSSNVYEARCIVLTRSHVFAASAKRFLQTDQMGYPSYAVVPVMELRHFSTMFMLSFGNELTRSVIRSELVASCDRIIRMSPDLTRRIRAVLGKIEGLEPAQLEAALEDPTVLTAFTVATGNDPSIVTAQNSAALLEVMRTAAAKDEELRHKSAERALVAQHEQALQLERVAVEAKAAEVEELKRVARAQQVEAARLQDEMTEQLDISAKLLARRVERQVNFYWGMLLILLFSCAAGAFIDMLYDFTSLSSPIQLIAGLAIGASALFLTLGSVLPAFSVVNLRPRLVAWTASRQLGADTPDDLRKRVLERLETRSR